MAPEASPTSIRDALQNWIASEGPLYRRLANGLRTAIDEARLPAGTMLPPERSLAGSLAVSRSTVVAAYEALKRSGYLEARQGSGTWVRGRVRPPDEGNLDLLEELEDHAIVRNIAGSPSELIEFAAASVECAPEVNEAMLAMDAGELAQWSVGNGYAVQGVEQLREVVAEHITHSGVPTTPDQVLITAGATQAILLAARLFIQPGVPAVVETPTYGGGIDILHAAGARLMTVDVDGDGAQIDQLTDLLPRLMPRLLYLVPDMHNPTGTVLTESRRADIASLAAELRIPVVEDLALRDLWFHQPPPPPIASFNPDATILTIGSMSKVFWAGLRVGWLRAPAPVVARLARLKVVSDFGTSILSQAVSVHLLPLMEQTAARRRVELQERLAALHTAGAAYLPEWEFSRPAGGLSVWAKLPEPLAEALARAAPEHGVSVVPGFAFAAEHPRHANYVRLPFVAEPEVIEEGLRRLGHAWTALERSQPSAPTAIVA